MYAAITMKLMYYLVFRWLCTGDAGWEEGHRWVVRRQNPEEGRGDPGRRCGVHHGGKESPRSGWKTSFPHSAALLFPDDGKDTQHLEFTKMSTCRNLEYLFSSSLFFRTDCILSWSISMEETLCTRSNRSANSRSRMLCEYTHTHNKYKIL